MTCLVLDLEQGSAGFCACDAAGKPELRREFGGHSAGDLWARCVSLLGGALEARLEEVNRRMTNYLRSDRLRDSACLGELTCAQAEQALAPVKEQLTALLKDLSRQHAEVLSRKNKAEKEKAGRQKEIEAAENEIHSYEEQVRNMDSQLERLTHAAAQAKQNYEDLPSYGEGGKRVLYILDHLPEQYRRLLPGRAAAEEERSGPENTDRQDRPDQSPGGVAEKDRMNLSRKTLGRPRKDYSYDRDFGDQVKSVVLIRGFAARGGGTGSGSFGGRLSDDLNELNPSLYQGFVSSVQKKNGLDRINTNMEAKRSRPERVT